MNWKAQYNKDSGLCLVPHSCPTFCDPTECSLPGSSVHGDSPGKNAGVGCHALLQGIFPTQGSNPGLPHCRQILYQLSHKGSPRILDVWPILSPVDLPNPVIKPGSPALQVDSLPAEPQGKPKNSAVGNLFLLQLTFLTQESNWGLLNCR